MAEAALPKNERGTGEPAGSPPAADVVRVWPVEGSTREAAATAAASATGPIAPALPSPSPAAAAEPSAPPATAPPATTAPAATASSPAAAPTAAVSSSPATAPLASTERSEARPAEPPQTVIARPSGLTGRASQHTPPPRPRDPITLSGSGAFAGSASDEDELTGARAVASRSAAAAEAALRQVQGGLREATRRFEAEQAEWDRVAERAALPEIRVEDPIAHLAIRLDRESAFWRGFAIRALRPGAPRTIALISAWAGLAGGVGLTGLAAMGVLFGAAATASVILAGAGALAIGVFLGLVSAWWLSRGNAKAAADALQRADDAERRLQRVAAVLALRRTDPTAFRDAVARLERP